MSCKCSDAAMSVPKCAKNHILAAGPCQCKNERTAYVDCFDLTQHRIWAGGIWQHRVVSMVGTPSVAFDCDNVPLGPTTFQCQCVYTDQSGAPPVTDYYTLAIPNACPGLPDMPMLPSSALLAAVGYFGLETVAFCPYANGGNEQINSSGAVVMLAQGATWGDENDGPYMENQCYSAKSIGRCEVHVQSEGLVCWQEWNLHGHLVVEC